MYIYNSTYFYPYIYIRCLFYIYIYIHIYTYAGTYTHIYFHTYTYTYLIHSAFQLFAKDRLFPIPSYCSGVISTTQEIKFVFVC